MANIKLSEAIKVIQEAMLEDKEPGSYYHSWQSNIAMAFFDEIRNSADNSASASYPHYEIGKDRLHEICNNAAQRFLDSFCKH